MPLGQSIEKESIKKAIQAFLREQAAQPFALLRESGAVAALREQLRLQEGLSGQIVATLKAHAKAAKPVRQFFDSTPSVRVKVDCVQLECKIVSSDEEDLPSNPRGFLKKRLDIAVLGDTPTLWCSDAAGDVLQQVWPHDLKAAIEVKASPSTSAERKEYDADIDKLLALKKHCPSVSAHFVLLDKGAGLYHPSGHTDEAWKPYFAADRPGIKFLANEPDDRPYVWVWSVDRGVNGCAEVISRYAVTAPPPTD